MRYQLTVVQHGDDKFFQIGKVLNNLLICHEAYQGGQIEVIRDGKVIDRGRVYSYGTQAEFPVFGLGLRFGWAGDNHTTQMCGVYPHIEAKYFEVGDVIVLSASPHNWPDFDLERYLDPCRELTEKEIREITEFEKSIGETEEEIQRFLADATKPDKYFTFEVFGDLKIYRRKPQFS